MSRFQSFKVVSTFFTWKRGNNLSGAEWGRVQTACALLMLCLATAIASPAQTFTTLFSFDSTGGTKPIAGLVQGADGKLFGTTSTGGTYSDGTVFEITSSGTLTTLHSFDGADGQVPSALIQGTDGNFYGTTQNQAANGHGTVFKITPAGVLTTLYSFCTQSNCTDGANPTAGLVRATNGKFYGTTSSGGMFNDGTVFEITSSGTLTALHSFDGADGQIPSALMQGTDGNFYGTTQFEAANGFGTAFQITPAGVLTTLYSFCAQSNCTDGANPTEALVQGVNGKLYGTTSIGGMFNSGTVFEITSPGNLSTLHSFDGADGQIPSTLILGTDGNFYGTTQYEASHGFGTAFQVTPLGTLTTLYSFCSQSNCVDGGNPVAGLLQDTSGVFYGTTPNGGANGDGAVFTLATGLKPFVETAPSSGKVGASVIILGSNLTRSTSVKFNGTAAKFTGVSGTIIKTTVPAGATTGPVTVTTSGGKLTSNVAFRVTQ